MMRQAGLSARLVVAIVAVLAAAGVTTLLVSSAIGPSLFHDHLVDGSERSPEELLTHAEIAFREASTRALVGGMLLGAVAALAVGVMMARRLGGSLKHLTIAAQGIADGRLNARVPDPRMGGEFEELAEAFNKMAGRLEAGDHLRQRLLSDVAHELRTPVASLHAYLESIEDGIEELNPEMVGLLRAEGARLIRLSDDLAAVTRAEGGQVSLTLAQVNPRLLLEDEVLRARARADESGIEMTIDIGDDLPTVEVDPERMSQVLGNLVSNALRHTPSGGTIALSGRRAEGGVELVVTDTGSGIPAEHLPNVFERFYRVDQARDRESGGSGIGLAIVKAFVEAHGGTVEVSSPGAGQGASFTVWLPEAH